MCRHRIKWNKFQFIKVQLESSSLKIEVILKKRRWRREEIKYTTFVFNFIHRCCWVEQRRKKKHKRKRRKVHFAQNWEELDSNKQGVKINFSKKGKAWVNIFERSNRINTTSKELLNRLKPIKIHRCFQTHTNKLKPNKGRRLEAWEKFWYRLFVLPKSPFTSHFSLSLFNLLYFISCYFLSHHFNSFSLSHLECVIRQLMCSEYSIKE